MPSLCLTARLIAIEPRRRGGEPIFTSAQRQRPPFNPSGCDMARHLNGLLLKQADHPAIAGYSGDIHQMQKGSEECMCVCVCAHESM